MWPEPIRLVVMKEGFMLDLILFATSASSTMSGYALQGHFKKDCPKLKNQNLRNKPVIPEARGKAYAIDVSYVVELADGRVAKTNAMLRGCTIGLLGHPFNIDLMHADLGSFDVIIDLEVYGEGLSSISSASYKEGNRSQVTRKATGGRANFPGAAPVARARIDLLYQKCKN
ncbi:hypothetical protein Tco_1551865, partial [Tanacetum coccineum]